MEINKEVEKAVDDALLLAEKGDISKSEILLKALQAQYPENHDVNFGLGVMKSHQGKLDEAIEYYSKATEIFPFHIEAHFNKALAFKGKYDIRNMVESLREVIAIGDPLDDLVQKAKSILTDFEQSIIDTDNITLEQYLHAQDIFETAFSYMQKKEWQKAIRKFEECLKISKHHAQSYGNIGICHAQMGRRREAIEALDKALEIDPEYEPAIYNKVLIESLAEDEELKLENNISIEYYEDFALKKKSYIKKYSANIPKNSNSFLSLSVAAQSANTILSQSVQYLLNVSSTMSALCRSLPRRFPKDKGCCFQEPLQASSSYALRILRWK